MNYNQRSTVQPGTTHFLILIPKIRVGFKEKI